MMLNPLKSNLEPFNQNLTELIFHNNRKRRRVYFCDSDGSNVLTVWSCSISSSKCSRQKTSNSFPCYSAIDCVFWGWRCSRQSCAGVVVSHRLNDGGQHPSEHPKHPCGTHSRHSPLTWKTTNTSLSSSLVWRRKQLHYQKGKQPRQHEIKPIIFWPTWIWQP